MTDAGAPPGASGGGKQGGETGADGGRHHIPSSTYKDTLGGGKWDTLQQDSRYWTYVQRDPTTRSRLRVASDGKGRQRSALEGRVEGIAQTIPDEVEAEHGQ